MSDTARFAQQRDLSDETLMAHYGDGDGDAFDELFRRYEPRAYAFFLKRTGSSERAEDLYQELFLRIHRARDRYDSDRPFTPWFFQIANRLLVDDHRRAFRHHEFSIEDREPRAEQRNAEGEVADREQSMQLLQFLSNEERYVLLAAKVDGVGYAEVANHLGKSVDAVKKTASRAIRRLRASVGPDGAFGLPVG